VNLLSSYDLRSLGLALTSLINVTSLLSALLMTWGSIENGTVGLQRIHEIVNLTPEEDPKTSVTSLAKDSPRLTKGSVVFEDFEMRYK
jgi:ABC-type bacteriocin/lantibiotic exporter with double-glycine peptidase domain